LTLTALDVGDVVPGLGRARVPNIVTEGGTETELVAVKPKVPGGMVMLLGQDQSYSANTLQGKFRVTNRDETRWLLEGEGALGAVFNGDLVAVDGNGRVASPLAVSLKVWSAAT
jgi:hypothetical protein